METTIFPVTLNGKVHAAFVLDYRTDEWATQCGKSVPDPTAVEHRGYRSDLSEVFRQSESWPIKLFVTVAVRLEL
jgi:hypothetical protein